MNKAFGLFLALIAVGTLSAYSVSSSQASESKLIARTGGGTSTGTGGLTGAQRLCLKTLKNSTQFKSDYSDVSSKGECEFSHDFVVCVFKKLDINVSIDLDTAADECELELERQPKSYSDFS